MMAPKRSLELMTQALDALTEHVEATPDPLAFPLNSTRIDYLPAELILPDPVQARRVLPEAIHVAFHSQQLTPVQALQELVRSAQLAARQNGRPFTSVIDLLADLGSEVSDEAELPKYTPEEQLVRDLVTLAATIRDDGQVNPLTVIDVSPGITRLFRIETGERRYWASWLLREFLSGYTGDGTIPCIILKAGQASVFRQARENMARAGLSAIAMARQAALLLMAVHGIPKPDYAVGHDFYRQALELDLRDKREHTDNILAAMGGISRSYFSRLKRLLALSDEAMELADLHQLDEAQLRYVLTLDPENHAEMVRQIIQFKLSMKQVKEMCEQNDDESAAEVEAKPSRGSLQLAKLMRSIETLTAHDLTQALLIQEKDVYFAKARLQGLKRLLNDVERQLEVT
ncbi:MAG: ParB/RepB/Spo0J family partition protein [Aggregatilineales bacterium]